MALDNYIVSEKYLNLIASDGRRFKAKIVCDDTEISTGFISVTTSALSTTSTDTITIGSATAAQVDITMVKPTISLTGKEFTLYLGLVTSDIGAMEEIVEYIPIGLYTTQKPTIYDGQISFTAYDRMISKMGGYYESELEYPCDVHAVCEEIESKVGITINNKPSGITLDKRVYSTDGSTTTYSNPFDGYTYQESVAYIAGLVGKFAVFNRLGELDIKWYSAIDYTVTTDMSYDDIVLSENPFRVEYVRCAVDADVTIEAGTGSTGISMSNFAMTQEILDAMFKTIDGFEYYPTTCSFKGDLRLELGDIIKVQTRDGTIYQLPIMSLAYDYDGGLSLSVGSFGNTEASEASYKSPTEVAINRIYQKFVVVNEMISTKDTIIISYTNISAYAIRQEAKEIIKIEYSTYRNCDPIFIATIPFTLDVDGYVEFKLYNGTLELEYGVYTGYYLAGENFTTISYVDTSSQDERRNLRVLCRTYQKSSSEVRRHTADNATLYNYCNALKAAIESGTAIEYSVVDVDTTNPTLAIGVQCIRASLFAQGVNGKSKWDGTLEFTDYFEPYNIAHLNKGLKLLPFDASVTTARQVPIPSGMTDKIGTYTFAKVKIRELH